GIAMGTGADVAMGVAGMTLAGGDIRGLLKAFALSDAVMRNIRQNLGFAFAYNIIALPVAAGLFSPLGFLVSPVMASAAMAGSSLVVVANALRLRHIRL
ncbi:MAG: hypothetical protein K2Q01_11600, partial [Rickettsiales bacterium]|nr:hypothetical protein [Rickettsiales bacterium]